MKKQISKNIFDFSNLIKALKKEKRKKIFLTPFWFKTSFKKQKPNFWIHFLILNKNEFQKVLSFFNFCYETEQWKIKNFQNLFCFEIKKGIILSSVHWKCHSIFWLKLKWKRTFFVFQFHFKTENWERTFLFENWKIKSVFRFPIFILFQNTKLTALSTYQSNFNKS